MITGKSALAIMSGFTRDDLRRISGEEEDGWRLSLYMPLHRTGREVRQAPILLKEMRSKAAAELEARGCDQAAIASLLAPINRIHAESDFTVLQGEGLAVLSGKGYSASFLMPVAPPALADVGRRFHLDPLLPLLFEDGRFNLLALSLNSVRLYQADRQRLREVPLEGLETNMKEALRFEDAPETYLSQRGAVSPIGRGSGNMVFHGHGGGRGDIKERKRDILDFFHQIDKGIQERIPESDLPLMLAGVEYLLPLYREANTNPNLVEGAVLGNPEATLKQEELHPKAWKVYRDMRDEEKKGILRLYGERIATPEAAAGLYDVLPAAWDKRILHLFLRKGYRQWGRFSPGDHRVELEDAPGPDREELVNFACIQTLIGGGKIHVLEPGEIPEEAEIAALLRY
jgi:hypothetical protein